MMSAEDPITKPIDGYPDYEISVSGDVYNRKTGRKLKNTVSENGYHRVCLYNNKVGRMTNVHRIVAQAFIENPANLPHVDHIDRDRSNNNESNLRWVTRSDNMRNVGTRSDNISGHAGISFGEKKNKRDNSVTHHWRARIVDTHGKRLEKWFEYSDSGKADAVKWRKDLEKKNGYL